MKKPILIFGGLSDERLVSVASAQNLCARFQFSEIWFVDPTGALFLVTESELKAHKNPFMAPFHPENNSFAKNLEAALPSQKNSVFFLAFHGSPEEDGTVQAIFEKQNISFTGSGSKASHQCFLKPLAKSLVAKVGLKVAQELQLNKIEKSKLRAELENFLKENQKIIIKPLANGSSVGLHVISKATELDAFIAKVKDQKSVEFMAETFIEGRELTVGVIEHNGKRFALPASEVLLKPGASFDYEGKYLGKGSTEITPAEVTKEQMKAAQSVALKAHETLGCRGYSRTDLIMTDSGFVFIEINTLPGLTKASFIPQQLAAAGLSLEDFIEDQLEL